MNLVNIVNQFYFDMTIKELRLMNSNDLLPNVTYNSLLYLDIIAYKEKCTVSFISEALNVAKSAVTLKVKELMQHGFVEKTQSQEDKRVYYLTVKPEVIAEYKVYDEALLQSLKRVEEKYSSSEIDTFCEILQIIYKGYERKEKNE